MLCFADWQLDDGGEWEDHQVSFGSMKIEKRQGTGRWEIPHQRPVPVHVVNVQDLVKTGFLGPIEGGVRQFRYADHISSDESKQRFPANPNSRISE